MREKILEACKGLEDDAHEIRMDWSDFDGRSNRDNVLAWTAMIRKALVEEAGS